MFRISLTDCLTIWHIGSDVLFKLANLCILISNVAKFINMHNVFKIQKQWYVYSVPLTKGQSLKESLLWVWGLVLVLFTLEQTSFSFSLSYDPFDHHLHIGYKMENEQLCNTSDFQSSVTLWRLPNKCLSSKKKKQQRLVPKENRTKWERKAVCRGRKWKK